MILTDKALEISGFNPTYLRDLLRDGRIRGEKIGRTWLVDEADLRRYMRTVKRGRPKAV